MTETDTASRPGRTDAHPIPLSTPFHAAACRSDVYVTDVAPIHMRVTGTWSDASGRSGTCDADTTGSKDEPFHLEERRQSRLRHGHFTYAPGLTMRTFSGCEFDDETQYADFAGDDGFFPNQPSYDSALRGDPVKLTFKRARARKVVLPVHGSYDYAAKWQRRGHQHIAVHWSGTLTFKRAGTCRYGQPLAQCLPHHRY